MRTISPLLTLVIAAGIAQPLRAQWGTDIQNNAINWELHIWESEYSGTADGDGSADPTIRTECYINGALQGTHCETWDCEPTCGDYESVGHWAGMGAPYTASLALYGVTFESDGADDCVYDGAYDDHLWTGYYTLRNGLADMPIVYSSPDFRPCNWNPWIGNGTTWLLPNTAEFDQRMFLTWRYSAGEYDDPLDFGTVAMDQTKTDVNANSPVTDQSSWTPLTYPNLMASTAGDVFYRFHLDNPMAVTISTNDGLTDFDTRLELYGLQSNTLIAENDDWGGTSSTISTQLCAGDYRVLVTGYGDYTGLFRLSVTAGAPSNFSVTVTEMGGTSCPGTSDGSLWWASSGGTAPVTYTLDGMDLGSAMYYTGLSAGPHELVATDACGWSTLYTGLVLNGDATPPTALCEAALSIEVIQGQNTVVAAADVDNGSSDNCGQVALSISPSSFDVSDVGIQAITLTVTDENNNSSTCTCSGLVQNVTGINEAQANVRIRVLPNPSDGLFRIDLSGAPLSPETRLTIVDALGRTVHASNVTRDLLDMDLGHLPDGAYMLRLNDPQWDATTRIVIRH